mmetsp:Transcript_58879/g.133293  ORF Transcript_58879/g.133293 Transcript_58879/m.133293 type:complete len:166 (-) Transcript_58879:140-637(-)
MRSAVFLLALVGLVSAHSAVRPISGSIARKRHGRPLAAANIRRPSTKPLAYAIPGDGIAETVFIGGAINFFGIYNFLLTGRILLSWFPQAQGMAFLRPLFTVTDPYLNVFRGLGLNFGGLDFSVLPAFFIVNSLQSALVSLAHDIPEHLRPQPPAGVTPRPQPAH